MEDKKVEQLKKNECELKRHTQGEKLRLYGK